MPLSENSLRLLATCTARYLSEVVEPNAAIITFVGANPRAVVRQIEDALDAAGETLKALEAVRETKSETKPEPDPADETPGEHNRRVIAKAVEEAAASGAPNA